MKPKSNKSITKSKPKIKTSKSTSNNSKIKKVALNVGKLLLIGSALGYIGYNAINTYKTVTTKTSFANKFKTEGDITDFVFDPKEKGEWNGDPGLAQVFLKEYLLKKYTDTCTMSNISLLVFNIISAEIEVIEKKNDKNKLIWESLGGNPKSKYIHITYSNDKSIEIFNDIINNQCKDKNFIIIPINLRITNANVHANILLYNRKTNTMEHYDPYGTILYDFQYNTVFGFLKDMGIEYASPNKICPYSGFQRASWDCPNFFFNFKSNLGYCLIWNLYLLELRLSNLATVDIKKLISDEVSQLKKNNSLNLCKFIIAYTQFILKFVKNYDLVQVDILGVKITIDYTTKK